MHEGGRGEGMKIARHREENTAAFQSLMRDRVTLHSRRQDNLLSSASSKADGVSSGTSSAVVPGDVGRVEEGAESMGRVRRRRSRPSLMEKEMFHFLPLPTTLAGSLFISSWSILLLSFFLSFSL